MTGPSCVRGHADPANLVSLFWRFCCPLYLCFASLAVHTRQVLGAATPLVQDSPRIEPFLRFRGESPPSHGRAVRSTSERCM